jgi:hypothetical protein
MDVDLRRRMLAYYNERAPEYEEAYTLGTGTASALDPSAFTTEARAREAPHRDSWRPSPKSPDASAIRPQNRPRRRRNAIGPNP